MQGVLSSLRVNKIVAVGVFVLFAYVLANAVAQLAGNFSLGMLARSAMPVGAVALVLLLVVGSRETWFVAPNLSLGRVVAAAVVALPATAFVLAVSAFDPTVFLVISGVTAAYVVSVFLILTSRGTYALLLFFLVFPLISFLEHSLPPIREFKLGVFAVTPSIGYIVLLVTLLPLTIAGERKGSLGSIPILLGSLAFVLVSLLSSLVSSDPGKSAGVVWLEVLAPFLVFVLVLRFADGERDVRVLTTALFAMVVGIAFISFYFLARYLGTKYATLYDAYGLPLFANVNSGSLALMILMGFPLGIALLSRESKHLARVLVGCSVVFLVAGLFLTFNRSAIGIMGVAQSLFLFKRRSRRVLLAGLGLVLLVAVLFAPVVQGVVSYRFQNVASPVGLLEDRSLGYRFNAWGGAIGIIRDYPVWGIGYGMWSKYIPAYGRLQPVASTVAGERASGYIVDPHNYYLDVATSAGLLGLVAWLGLLGVAFREAIYVMRRSPTPVNRDLALGVLVALLGMCLLSLLGGGMHEGVFIGMGVIFWSLIGLISVMGARTRLLLERKQG